MTRLLLIPLLFVSLTAKALDPVATPVNNLVGVSGLQPWDNDVMNNLLRSVPATYALCALDYNWWVNGTGNPGFLGGDGPAFYDTMMSINSPYKIILAFYNVPTQKIASFVPMILARYVIWAVQPVNEVADAAQTSDTIKAFRSAAPTARLLGPCLQDDYAPAYLDALVASNALAEIDVLAMHDYAACPGNGGASPQPWGSYVHPSAAPDIYHPNLLGRIQWLQSYANKLRNVFTDGPKVMLTEYGLYVNDLNDARLAANISRITGVPLVLSSPGAPANQTNSHPYGNGIYSASGKAAVWSAAMQTYVQTMQSPTLLAWAWYAAPDAAASGDGSFQSPWPLPVALAQNTVIQPGDTLYLRGGYYRSPGFFSDLTGTSDNYITVRSAPNEWAVITDGAAGALLTNLSGTNAPTSGVANVSIGGSQFWSVGTVVQIGMEQLLLYGQTGTNWTLTRGWNGTAVAPHTQGEIVRPRSDFITHTGSYVKFQDFEITAGGSTNRIVGTNNYLGSGLNLPAPGQGNKAINLIIHNVGHPGIGFWSQGNGGEINGCIMWGNGMYDNDGAWTRGTAVCAQNETGTVNLKNNIALRNFTEGMQAYGTAAATKGFRFINNISMMNANGVGISIWNTYSPSRITRCGRTILVLTA